MSVQNYDELAKRLTDESQEVRSAGQIKTGEAAAEAGRAFLRAEYGSDPAIQHAIRAGRPRAGEEKNVKSPVVRGIIPQSEFEKFEVLRSETGLSQSALVREAIRLLLEQRGRAS